jgi:hypothetical protein
LPFIFATNLGVRSSNLVGRTIQARLQSTMKRYDRCCVTFQPQVLFSADQAHGAVSRG